ncbi:uncharacterized protein SCHCODRAFT_02123200 [Schizophyllum commune H4-8]|uniref:uncharacterized protein n=1 Tax=Schizophyllum commune (strain H4-8 / FGSC 9210) TaxID=578458 RepID=UPI00215E8BF9|nr:uncharacterized protein SCHCODRAFT_02123200 [Schizophyllum commune H4-8]KAI5885243.1 hypothetical protein SCHCODRAFT_02123200 [Schizophyllum commune H4-8]
MLGFMQLTGITQSFNLILPRLLLNSAWYADSTPCQGFIQEVDCHIHPLREDAASAITSCVALIDMARNSSAPSRPFPTPYLVRIIHHQALSCDLLHPQMAWAPPYPPIASSEMTSLSSASQASSESAFDIPSMRPRYPPTRCRPASPLRFQPLDPRTSTAICAALHRAAADEMTSLR